MPNNIYRIYDRGPGFMVLLVEVAPGEPRLLEPRYELCRWTYYRDLSVCETPESWHEESNYLAGAYDCINEAIRVLERLNRQHREAFIERGRNLNDNQTV